MDANLYVTSGSGAARYWYAGAKGCSVCEKTISPLGVIVRRWARNGNHEDLYFCLRCLAKIPEEDTVFPVQERLKVVFCDSAPPKSRLVIPTPPALNNGHISAYDAVDDRRAPADRVDDRTRCAGRPGFTFQDGIVTIGADVRTQIEEKDAPIDARHGIKLLDDLSLSK